MSIMVHVEGHGYISDLWRWNFSDTPDDAELYDSFSEFAYDVKEALIETDKRDLIREGLTNNEMNFYEFGILGAYDFDYLMSY